MNTPRGVVVLCMGIDKGPAKRLWEDLNSSELAWAKITLPRTDPHEPIAPILILARATWEGPPDAPVAFTWQLFQYVFAADGMNLREASRLLTGGSPPVRITAFPWPLHLVGWQQNGPAFYVREDAWPELAP